ncbi:flagellar biosynthetic protein FliR [Azospirillum thermophilum]|uniref:Flagellar biosynthesis protein n=1 Tax=Azospirillum thermophilum TaxID=2202148 RepID=A0A2S2CUR9_9PROT|nr:flagellar biosynthetic protein FliR [Azospirillum thermophilum]AWK88241.1 flagellar biosynthesis protein [Azospirillum thermophilum]
MDMLAQLIGQEIYGTFLVFVRVAAAIGLLPGFGEYAVPMRVRLMIAVVTALALARTVTGLPPIPPDAAVMAGHMAAEMLVGAFLGLGAKLFLAALQVSGNIAAQAVGLANPFNIEGAGFEGGSMLSGTLVIAALAALFATDVHYLMLDALVRSYGTWPAAVMPDIGMMAGRFAQLVAGTFRLGVELAAPFLVFGLIVNVALGLINRVMPAMPVYFVGTPAMLGAGLIVFMVTAGVMLTACLAALTAWLAGR